MNQPVITWNFDIYKTINEASMQGLGVWGELVLTEAKKRCPQETGTLRRSGAVTFEPVDPTSLYEQAKGGDVNPSKGNPDSHELIISFNAPYAHRQHEDMSFNHTTGQAKYLESAIDDKRKLAEKIVAQEIKKKLS